MPTFKRNSLKCLCLCATQTLLIKILKGIKSDAFALVLFYIITAALIPDTEESIRSTQSKDKYFETSIMLKTSLTSKNCRDVQNILQMFRVREVEI